MTRCQIRPLITCDSWARLCSPFDVNNITNAVASDDIHNLRRTEHCSGPIVFVAVEMASFWLLSHSRVSARALVSAWRSRNSDVITHETSAFDVEPVAGAACEYFQ